MTPQTLADFITAALDADEALARAATPGPWQWWNLEGADQGWSGQGPNLETVERGPVYPDGSQGALHTVVSGWGHDAWGTNVDPADAAHIAAQDPAATLRRIAATRAVLALHKPDEADHCKECGSGCDGKWPEDTYWWPVPYPCPTIRALASAYADRPTWREEWE